MNTVLKSLRDGSLYVGVTKRPVEERLREHNAAKTEGNRNRLPYELVFTENYVSYDIAVRREAFLKTGKGRHVLKNLTAAK